MSAQFWRICSEALDLVRQGKRSEAHAHINRAELVLDGEAVGKHFHVQRRQFLEALRYRQELKLASDAGPGYTQDEPASIRKLTKSNTSPGQSSQLKASYEKSALEIELLKNSVKTLEAEKAELVERVKSLPSIDPLSFNSAGFVPPGPDKEAFGIIVFGHTRLDTLEPLLESLSRQDALQYTEIWLDGFQGNPALKKKVESTFELASKYPVKLIHRQAGQYGFRKMLILGLIEMCNRYKDILILEDDCFPTRDAVSVFRAELDQIRNDPEIFSVYGHPFLTESETDVCARFQGWGWATTSEKLSPVLRQLIDCYSMPEDRYLQFVKLSLTDEIRARIEVTPPRQPSHTLERFFAWDETLGLLVAMNNQVHKPTSKRTIYNCGMNQDSTHFGISDIFRQPPYNLITPDEVWQYF